MNYDVVFARQSRPTSRTPWRRAASSAGSDRACIGGRTNHYARVQLRYSDYDFKTESMRGVGWDWPISYADLAPYYDKAERFIGVTGKPEGLRSAPDGIFQTPAPFKPHEHPAPSRLREARASRRRARARR